MLLVTVINILIGPVLLEYINLFKLNHNGNIKEIFAYPWPHTNLYLSLTN